MDYTYLYKHSYQRIDEIQNLLPYDIFISSYVNSQRVQEPADNIQAGQKIWFATEEEGRDLYLSGKDVTFVKANEANYRKIRHITIIWQVCLCGCNWLQGPVFDVSNAVHVYV